MTLQFLIQQYSPSTRKKRSQKMSSHQTFAKSYDVGMKSTGLIRLSTSQREMMSMNWEKLATISPVWETLITFDDLRRQQKMIEMSSTLLYKHRRMSSRTLIPNIVGYEKVIWLSSSSPKVSVNQSLLCLFAESEPCPRNHNSILSTANGFI